MPDLTRAGSLRACLSAVARSQIDLPGMQRVRAGHSVQEEQAVAVIDLMLQSPRLEGICCDQHSLAAQGKLSRHGDLGRTLHISGEMRHGHTTLATLLVATGLH